ncbi:1-acyl-sn-glycerol-3-phosphate acyltransferase [Aestuariirhabdus sp. LZHN29]|uniref:1-acyl-sn-glycerol-3-phosphate acyltransferase n=1 Tax=Aestuariirhabdus sp. LZHN29 TaxID=3417462 RepID=UPI003CECDE82
MSSNYSFRSPWAEWVGRGVLGLMGWKIEGELPSLPKYIIVVGYHTSNWDFVVLVAAKLVLRLRARWFGKHTLFRWPLLGPLFRLWGGVAIERHQSRGVVDQAVEAFSRHEHFLLALSPEGTRSLTSGWKEGFFHIAQGAGVPILPVGLDFEHRRIVIGEEALAAPCFQQEVERLTSFYNKYPPCHPELAWRGGEESDIRSQK